MNYNLHAATNFIATDTVHQCVIYVPTDASYTMPFNHNASDGAVQVKNIAIEMFIPVYPLRHDKFALFFTKHTALRDNVTYISCVRLVFELDDR